MNKTAGLELMNKALQKVQEVIESKNGNFESVEQVVVGASGIFSCLGEGHWRGLERMV